MLNKVIGLIAEDADAVKEFENILEKAGIKIKSSKRDGAYVLDFPNGLDYEIKVIKINDVSFERY